MHPVVAMDAIVEAASGIVPLPPKVFAAHAATCKRTSCLRCSWFRQGTRWRSRCKLAGPESQTWLSCTIKTKLKKKSKSKVKQLLLGCEVCRRYMINNTGTFQKALKKDLEFAKYATYEVSFMNYLRRRRPPEKHAQSRLHLLACQALVDKETSETMQKALLDSVGPSQTQWRAVFDKYQKGKSARDGEGCSDRVALMRWCIAEAVLDRWRTSLRTVRSFVLIRDERQGRLLLRFRSTLQDFSILSGIVGCEELSEGKKAVDIHTATKNALRHFCTERSGAPRNFKGSDAAFNADLFAHLQDKCEMIVTDCASAELLAQDIARGKRPEFHNGEKVTSSPMFENIRLVGRDRAHACGRLIERPWNASPCIMQILEERVSFFFRTYGT